MSRCPVCGLYLADPPAGDDPNKPDDAPDKRESDHKDLSPWRRFFEWVTDNRT